MLSAEDAGGGGGSRGDGEEVVSNRCAGDVGEEEK